MQDKLTENTERRGHQRLVGGLVVLALAVIFIPMALDFNKGYDHSISKTNIPPRPGVIKIETLDLPGEEPVGVDGKALPLVPPMPINALPVEKVPAAEAPAGKIGKQQAEQPVPAEVMPLSVPPRPPSSAPASADHPGPTAQQPGKTDVLPVPVAWAVQVGSFNNMKNALALRNHLRQQRFPAIVERLTVNGKVIIRVLVGPELTKNAATRRHRALKKQLQLPGIVIRYR